MDVCNKSESNIDNKTIEYPGFNTAELTFNLLIMLPENVYVIWLIVTGAGNGVALEFFSLNLCVCEILLCLQSFLCLLSSTVPRLLLLVAFLHGIPVTGRPLFQSLICVERYLAVVHPVTFLKYKPLRYRVICSAVVWIIIIINCLLIALTVIPEFSFICYCLCQALVTLCVQLFCLVAVLRALKQSGPGERVRENANIIKRKAFYNILLIMMAILFIYAAYLVAILIYVLTNKFISMLWNAGQVCFWLGGLVQPLLYLHRTGKLPFCKTP